MGRISGHGSAHLVRDSPDDANRDYFALSGAVSLPNQRFISWDSPLEEPSGFGPVAPKSYGSAFPNAAM